jgi:hypothetical protein
MSFLFSVMFFLQQSWRRGQNRFCLQVRRERKGDGEMARGRGGPDNVYTHE